MAMARRNQARHARPRPHVLTSADTWGSRRTDEPAGAGLLASLNAVVYLIELFGLFPYLPAPSGRRGARGPWLVPKNIARIMQQSLLAAALLAIFLVWGSGCKDRSQADCLRGFGASGAAGAVGTGGNASMSPAGAVGTDARPLRHLDGRAQALWNSSARHFESVGAS